MELELVFYDDRAFKGLAFALATSISFYAAPFYALF